MVDDIRLNTEICIPDTLDVRMQLPSIFVPGFSHGGILLCPFLMQLAIDIMTQAGQRK